MKHNIHCHTLLKLILLALNYLYTCFFFVYSHYENQGMQFCFPGITINSTSNLNNITKGEQHCNKTAEYLSTTVIFFKCKPLVERQKKFTKVFTCDYCQNVKFTLLSFWKFSLRVDKCYDECLLLYGGVNWFIVMFLSIHSRVQGCINES